MTGCDKKQCSCNSKAEKRCTEIGDKSYTLSGIGLNFSVYHLPLSQQGDGFQLLVGSGSSKHLLP